MRTRVTPLVVALTACAAALLPAAAPARAAPPPVPEIPGAVDFDPRLALLPVGAGARINMAQADVDRSTRGKARAEQRARKQAQQLRSAPAAAPPRAYAEREPAATLGHNDNAAGAEALTGFGTARGHNHRAVISGTLAAADLPADPQAAEDNGAIPLAVDTGLGGTRTVARYPGVIGDGPHGSGGGATGDFDFYKVVTAAAGAVSIDVTATGALNTVVMVWSATGTSIAYVDDPGADIHQTVQLPDAGDWYVMISGFGTYPQNPMDPASGFAPGTEGGYTLQLATEVTGDQDWYAADLRAGDVLGATVDGVAGMLSFVDAAGTEVQSSTSDSSGSYSLHSPLPGGGNATVDLVAPRAGRYHLAVRGGTGAYTVKLEVYRPGAESAPAGTVQTLFLDFDGARVNTSMFQQQGKQADLSPLRTFLPAWGLTAADENRVIDATVAAVKENMVRDVAARGTNPGFALRVLNSRDHADPFGKPGVSRVVVGGTTGEAGIDTIGIAQSNDPGNFGTEETALLLLDYVSKPAPNPNSFNTFAAPGADKAAFVGRALGNYVAHEAGHFTGTWHTRADNAVANLLDQGGNPTQMVGAGPDGLGGTADDVDVDYATDVLDAQFTGVQDTMNRIAWGYGRGRG